MATSNDEAAARANAVRRNMVAVEEAERRRLSRELHDQIGQQLTAFAFGVEEAERLAEEVSDGSDAKRDLFARLDQLKTLAREMLQGARYLALELRPPELDDMGFEHALETYVSEWSTRFGIAAEILATPQRSGDVERALPPEVASALFRIAQEALTNVAKHAHASAVSVIIEKTAIDIRLIVEDNGTGYQLDATLHRARRERRLGLVGMQERAALLGGEVKFESSRGHGTTVFACLPMDVDPPLPEQDAT